MQPDSSAWKAYQKISHTGQLFTDTSFDNSKALQSSDANYSHLLWTRYSGKCSSLLGVISPEDIKQGAVGDCYFVCALAATAQYPERIKKLFKTQNLNSTNGAYVLRVWANGEAQEVILDDFIPENPSSGRPEFLQSLSGQLWVSLIEKCWAKLCGSYANIIKGSPAEALQFLTGAPCDRIEHSEYSENQIWQELCDSINQGYIVCGSAGSSATQFCGDASAPDYVSVGLHSDHGYSVLNYVELKQPNGVKCKLLLLKNPLGYSEWSGDWSKSSTKWSEALVQQLPDKMTSKSDGSFYMSVGDYLKYFRATYICRENSKYRASSIQCKVPQAGRAVCIKIVVAQNTKAVFTVTQKSQRFVRITQPTYELSRVYALLGIMTSASKAEYLCGALGKHDDVSLAPVNDLPAGEYIIYIELDNKSKEGVPTFSLRAYADQQITITELTIPEENSQSLLSSILKSCAIQKTMQKTYEEHGCALIKRYSAINDTKGGFGYYYYINESKDIVLNEYTTLSTMKGISFKKTIEFKGITSNNEYEVHLPPHSETILILKKTGLDSQVSAKQKINIGRYKGGLEETKEEVKSDLIQLIISKGKERQIPKTELFLYDLLEKNKMYILIQNKSRKNNCSGKFEFQVKNLKFVEGGNVFDVQIPPCGTILKELECIKPGVNAAFSFKFAPQAVPVAKEVKKKEVKKQAKKISPCKAKMALDNLIDSYKDLN